MYRAGRLLAPFAGALALGAAAHAAAAPVAPDKEATASVAIQFPATIRKLEDLHFAYLTETGAGTATIDPNTDALTTTGGVLYISGLPYAALFEGVAPSGGVVIIRLPRDPIVVTRMGGTETMVVSDWTVSGNGRRTVVSQEPFNFKVGGTLYVNAGQAEGVYTGTFTVDIQYP